MINTTLHTVEASGPHGDVVVKRDLSREDQGIVGSLRIRSLDPKPVVVRIVDEFPGDLSIDEAGFNPEREPESGNITSHRAEIEQTVRDEPVRIEYRIEPTGSTERVQFDAPTIRDVKIVEAERPTVPRTDGGERSSPIADESDDQSGTSESERSTEGGEPPESGGSARRHTPGPGTETGTVGPEVGGGADRSGVESDGGDRDADSGPPTEADAPAEDANRTAVRGNGPSGGAVQSVPRSVEARLNHLSASVQEFSAFATVLEDTIDEYGLPPEFFGRIEDDLADIDGRLQSIRDELETVQNRHAGEIADLGERTDEVERRLEDARNALGGEIDDVRDRIDDEVARLDDEVADRGSELDDLGDRLDERIAAVDGDVEDIRERVRSMESDFSAVSDEVRAMDEELESLRDEVREFREVRESLVDVFDPPVEGGDSG